MADSEDDKEALTERFARAVKDARERAGMSQAALAEAVSSSLDHIGKLERGKYLPGLQVARQLIKTLGLDANALLDAKPRKRKASRQRLEKEAAMLRLIETLDDRSLDTATDLLEVVASRARRERR
jgi:ribosome-binding protein aMBF1 (putative translation factor)